MARGVRVDVICEGCGETMSLPESWAAKRKTCSRACALDLRAHNRISAEERRRRKAEQERERRAAKREEAGKPARGSGLKPSAIHPAHIRCAAVDCDKFLTVAAVSGGSDFHSRECAGFGVQSEWERGREAREHEPSPDELAAVEVEQ
jgi:hypothetical protein